MSVVDRTPVPSPSGLPSAVCHPQPTHRTRVRAPFASPGKAQTRHHLHFNLRVDDEGTMITDSNARDASDDSNTPFAFLVHDVSFNSRGGRLSLDQRNALSTTTASCGTRTLSAGRHHDAALRHFTSLLGILILASAHKQHSCYHQRPALEQTAVLQLTS